MPEDIQTLFYFLPTNQFTSCISDKIEAIIKIPLFYCNGKLTDGGKKGIKDGKLGKSLSCSSLMMPRALLFWQSLAKSCSGPSMIQKLPRDIVGSLSVSLQFKSTAKYFFF